MVCAAFTNTLWAHSDKSQAETENKYSSDKLESKATHNRYFQSVLKQKNREDEKKKSPLGLSLTENSFASQ